MAQTNPPKRGAASPESGQPKSGAKGLTGRGEAPAEVRQAAARVDKIHRAQADLSRLTRRVRGRTFYLSIHRRKPTGQLHLRWRSGGAGPHAGHIPWGEIEACFAHLPGVLRDWYDQAHRRALELNRREIEARLALRHAQERCR